jgi:hypothetical protein
VRGPAVLDTDPRSDVSHHARFPCRERRHVPLFARWRPPLHLLHPDADASVFVSVLSSVFYQTGLSAVMSRENDLIKTVRQLTYSDKYMGKKVLPLMAKDAFLDVMAGDNSFMPALPEKPTHAHARTHTHTHTCLPSPHTCLPSPHTMLEPPACFAQGSRRADFWIELTVLELRIVPDCIIFVIIAGHAGV